jgi:hypothetical protein
VEAYWRAYRGESNASLVPTLDEVREELARQRSRRGPKPGYVIRVPALSHEADGSTP